MSFSIYTASIPVFARSLRAMAAVLDKGRAHAEARKFDPAILIEARLAPDMHPLRGQVQIACDIVKAAGGRLAQTDRPSHPDTEKDFPALAARIEATVSYLEGLDPAAFEGSEARIITLNFPGREMTFSGADYLTGFVLPNLYFHAATTYGILRHNGVTIGKADYLGA